MHEKKKKDAQTHFVGTPDRISGIPIWLIPGLACLWAGAICAAIPELEDGVYIQSAGVPLAVRQYTTPSVVDWNHDGKKDLLVGQYNNGYIWVYMNRGTDAHPVFTTAQQLLVKGQYLTTSYL
jgi:hypothetical protein